MGYAFGSALVAAPTVLFVPEVICFAPEVICFAPGYLFAPIGVLEVGARGLDEAGTECERTAGLRAAVEGAGAPEESLLP